MHAVRFWIFILMLWVPAYYFAVLTPAAAALEPMDEAELDSVRAQSGIVLAWDDVAIYGKDDYFGYQDTTGDDNRVAFADTTSYIQTAAKWPVLLRVFQTDDGIPLVGLEALSNDIDQALENTVRFDTESVIFQVEGDPDSPFDLGGLRFRADLPSAAKDLGFLEQFAVYTAPLQAVPGYADHGGIAFQFMVRTGFDELTWDYNPAENDALTVSGFKMAGSFNPAGDDHTLPATWVPEEHFIIGDLDAFNQGNAIRPATFEVLSEGGEGIMRMNLPMEGSIRIEDVEMYDLNHTPISFGPAIIDGLNVRHLQVDFRP